MSDVPFEMLPSLRRSVQNIMCLNPVRFLFKLFPQNNILLSFVCKKKYHFNRLFFQFNDFHHTLINGSDSTSSSDKEYSFVLFRCYLSRYIRSRNDSSSFIVKIPIRSFHSQLISHLTFLKVSSQLSSFRKLRSGSINLDENLKRILDKG